MPVHHGMIVGEHTRLQGLNVNPLKGKQLTNIRTAGKGDGTHLGPPRPKPFQYVSACGPPRPDPARKERRLAATT